MKMEDHDDDDDDDDDHDEDESTEYRIVKEDSDHSISVCNVKTLNTAIIARSGNCWLQLQLSPSLAAMRSIFRAAILEVDTPCR